MIGIINYNGGNFKSVSNSLEYLKIEYLEICFKNDFNKVSHIILPGVGTYSELIYNLKTLNLYDELFHQIKDKQKYYLGICVGMQILSTYGLEIQKTRGLNLISGIVKKMKVTDSPLPNIGWHNIILENKKSILFDNIPESELFFYFVHSYYLDLLDINFCSSSIFYDNKFTASVESKNIFGVQFHPEKSQKAGLQVLKNFCNL